MAHLHNLPHNVRNPGMLENIGQKVKTGAEIMGGLKGIYDTGKMLYSGFKIAQPFITAAMLL